MDGVDITAVPEKALHQTRICKVGFVFQTFNLMPWLNAVENVELPMEGTMMKKDDWRQKRAKELLQMVGLSKRVEHRPHKLSAGEQQRVAIARATLKVGDQVVAVGTPYGLAGSMSNGIVSALNRTLTTDEYSINGVIQTTAPLNPGNSGGPLLNYQGEVVGINTAIVEDSQGIGFAIPSDIILEAIEEMLQDGSSI